MWTLTILAEQAAGPLDGDRASSLVRFVSDHPFAVGVGLVFLVAMVAAFATARKRDRCLKKFRGFRVTLTEQSGRQIWGLLKVFSAGLELEYDTPFGRPAKRSFLMYEGDLGGLLALCRFTDRLSEANARRCRRQARRLAHPPFASRVARWARNVVNTFRDAFVKAMGMTVQQATQAAPSPVLAAQGGQINAIGTILIGETANAYEPMIEQYIGRPVILEVINPADTQKRVAEYHGYLADYSAQFVMLVGVRNRFTEQASMDGTVHRFLEDAVEVRGENQVVHVANRSGVPVVVEGMAAGDACHDLHTSVAPGETAELAVPEGIRSAAPAPKEGEAAETTPAKPPTVGLAWDRTLDLIVPRAVGIIRHASEAAKE